MKYFKESQFGLPKISFWCNFQDGEASKYTTQYIEPYPSAAYKKEFQLELNDQHRIIAYAEKKNALNRIEILTKKGIHEEVILVTYTSSPRSII
ncbi:MAG: hypothetical protein ACJASQ_000515 [Crocinitomicaceae bacterium]|jgi:hypothetical protein